METHDTHDQIVEGLTARARNLLRALDRQDRLETAETSFIGWLAQEMGAESLSITTRELLLRALRTGADSINFQILRLLDPLEAISLTEIMEQTKLPRVAASERINDLVQVGLASREMIDDQIRGTALTSGLVVWLETISDEAGTRLKNELQIATPESGNNDTHGHP